MKVVIVVHPPGDDWSVSPAGGILNAEQEKDFRKKHCPYCNNLLYYQNGYAPSKECGTMWLCAAGCQREYFILKIGENHVAKRT